MKLFNTFFFAFLSFNTFASAANDNLPMRQIMTDQEINEIGLGSASPEQRQAFEKWAAQWTKRVIEQAPSYRRGENLSSWVQQWPSHADPTKTEMSEEDLLDIQQENQKVDKVLNDGAIVELKDGSIWQVSPVFRYLSTTWERNQAIEVKQSNNVRHPYSLRNVNLDQVVEADLKQPPSPTGKKREESPEYYKGSTPLVEISGQGDVLTLADNSSWKIAPLDIFRVRDWKQNDRIKVQKANNYLYQYRLTNLDTGETALANKTEYEGETKRW
jgi:hypothetical protein